MDELGAAAAVEAVSMEVDLEEGMALGENADLQVGRIRPEIQEDELTGEVADDPSKREGNGQRRMRLHTRSCHIQLSFIPPRRSLTRPANLPSQVPMSSKRPPVARKVCFGAKGYPELPILDGEPTDACNELVYEVRSVLYDLFSTSRSSVRWVDESHQLDQEEALAYVLAHLLRRTILPTEARNIGELARHAALAYKGKPPKAKGAKPKKPPADQALKDAASTAKSKAKAEAAKNTALAAGLAQRIGDIDAKLDADRRKLARTVVELPWPARNSVMR
jgi:hypothetical protein